MSGVRHVDIVDTGDVGQRVDNFLLRELKGVPRSRIYRLLRRGEVRVNGGRVKPTYRLKLEDRVRVPPVVARESAPISHQTGLSQRLLDATLFEDEDYLLIEKPHGIAVHGGSGLSSGVIEQLRLRMDNPRLALVHRLDRGTSGVLALAKGTRALRAAQAAFRRRRVSKIYETIVIGAWTEGQRTLSFPLERYVTRDGERRVRVSHAGDAARTDVEPIEVGRAASRLRIILHTGRTHQIRVHLAHVQHPILGDDKYGTRQQPEHAARLYLHATQLKMNLDDGRVIQAAAPPDAQWDRVVAEFAASDSP